MHRVTRSTLAGVVAVGLLAVSGCSDDSPLDADDGRFDTIVVGSQDYYSNEIIAEIYATALEDAGYDVDRQLRIGQREAYLPELEAGSIDLFPEYSGPVLQYWEPDTSARLADDVYTELQDVAPDGLNVLDQSPATDQDSYTVTRDFADRWGISSVEDLTDVTDPIILGANSEAENRPNGPKGLLETYGVEVGFTPVEDSGGPLTVKALKDGDIQMAIIYTADPSIAENDLVSLEDTKGLFLASHIVPLASDSLDAEATDLVNRISAAMTPETLVSLNKRSVSEQRPASAIAADWLGEQDVIET